MRVGSLFSGYGGLEMGLEAVMDTELAWVSDIDKGACKILAHRYPDVPNLGDITTIDWSTVEPVDVITGGSPCQDLSHAGKRGGMTEGTRSNLWVAMREAIAQLKPSLVVWENVRGAYSAAADSEVEPCPGCVGNRPGEPALRALGRVLGDLSDLGYDCGWYGLRAADVGAPHGRFRVFVVAHATQPRQGDRGRLLLTRPPTDADTGTRDSDTPEPATHADEQRHERGREPRDRWAGPTDCNLLPTPAVNDMGEGKTVDAWDEWPAAMQEKHGNGNGHGKSLAIETQRLLPTPNVAASRVSDSPGEMARDSPAIGAIACQLGENWGVYADAIARWETLTRPAPPPTMQSKKGTAQLNPAFSEWMMGLPAGWVTDVPGITRNEALKAIGNGVVPQQAAAAVSLLLDRIRAAA